MKEEVLDSLARVMAVVSLIGVALGNLSANGAIEPNLGCGDAPEARACSLMNVLRGVSRGVEEDWMMHSRRRAVNNSHMR